MARSRADGLWGGIEIPDEIDDVAMFERFQRIRAGTASSLDRDLYARQLMKIVSLTFIRKGYMRSLLHVGIEAEDAAQLVLAHLSNQTERMNVTHPCPKVMLSLLIVSCIRHVITQIRTVKRRPAAATDVGGHIADSLDCLAAPSEGRQLDRSHLRRLFADGGDMACRGLPDAREMYRLMWVTQLRRGQLIRHDQLPERFAGVSRETFNLVVTRMRRLLSQMV
jgi:hypothetical protein